MARMLKTVSLESVLRQKTGIKLGIVMDDKLITVEAAWEQIDKLSEADMAEFIVNAVLVSGGSDTCWDWTRTSGSWKIISAC